VKSETEVPTTELTVTMLFARTAMVELSVALFRQESDETLDHAVVPQLPKNSLIATVGVVCSE